MENKITPEILEKAGQAKSAEELIALAEENGYPLDEERARKYFGQLNRSGELSDEELDNVAGGGCYRNGRLIVTMKNSCDLYECASCGQRISGGRCLNAKTHSCKVELNFISSCCHTCRYCSYEHGMWYCNHPERMKK